MWEDPYNREGGKWVVTLRPKIAKIFDIVWARIIMGIIGERISAEGNVCGAVVSILYIRPKKFRFFFFKLIFLGLEESQGGPDLRLDPKKR